MPMKTATVMEIADAASAYAKRDTENGKTDPDGAAYSWRSVKGLWNSSTASESKRVTDEWPLAYQNFVGAYLRAQGWRR